MPDSIEGLTRGQEHGILSLITQVAANRLRLISFLDLSTFESCGRLFRQMPAVTPKSAQARAAGNSEGFNALLDRLIKFRTLFCNIDKQDGP